MKNPCSKPKTLHPIPHTLNPNSGFTLIELMVVTAITAILVGGGIAAYNRFNESQILNQAAITLKTNLRDAQNRGLSGEKVCGPSDCGGTNTICGDEAAYDPTNNPTGERSLDGWQVEFDSSPTPPAPDSYTISGSCQGVEFSDGTINLPSELQISGLPSPNPILFKSLAHGTDVANDYTEITLQVTSNPSKIRAIRVYRSGDIVIP